ncbi:MAG TPA: tetratricopeptide repeat protein [Burkholderiaceae bacterium]|nr:tetratricopeptide repeat protein [Burkholderiaceae bacterium]
MERLESFVRQDPSNPGLLLDLAGEHLANGNLERALELAERAGTLAPDSSLAASLRTLCLLSQGQVQRAREVHRAFMSTWTTPEAARRFLWVFQRAGKAGEAGDDLEQLLTQPGLAADRSRVLVRALHAAGQPARALHHLANLLRGGHSTPADEGLQALLLFDTQQLPQAHAQVQRCMARGAMGVEAHYVAASLRLLEGQVEAAHHHVEQALALHPDEGRCLSLRGQLALAQRRYAQAAGWLEQAAQQMPGHVGSRQEVGWCRVLQHNLPAARAAFEQALALDRNFAESHGALAVVDALEARTADARRGIARALRLDSGCLSAVLAQKLLGRASSRAGQNLHDELLAVLQQLPAVGGGTMLQFLQRLSRPTP